MGAYQRRHPPPPPLPELGEKGETTDELEDEFEERKKELETRRKKLIAEVRKTDAESEGLKKEVKKHESRKRKVDDEGLETAPPRKVLIKSPRGGLERLAVSFEREKTEAKKGVISSPPDPDAV